MLAGDREFTTASGTLTIRQVVYFSSVLINKSTPRANVEINVYPSMSTSRMDEYHLLANHNTTEGKESFFHTDSDNEDPESSTHTSGLRSRRKRCSPVGTLWEKYSLTIALVLSVMANTLFGFMSLVMMNNLKSRNQVESGPPDVSLYGKSMTVDDCPRMAEFRLTAI